MKNIVHLTYTGNHYSMALGGAVLIWSCGLEGKSRGVLTRWATGTWCRYLQQSLNSLSDAREPLFLQNQLRWTQCVLVGFDRGRGEKQNTNISLFTEKVHNISNKTYWHKQVIQGKLVLVLQALKICKYRLLRGDAKGWSALSVNKQDPRLIMKSFPCTAYKIVEKCSSHLLSQWSTICKVVLRCRQDRMLKRHLWHMDNAYSRTLDRKTISLYCPLYRTAANPRLSETRPCGYSTSPRGCYFIPSWSTESSITSQHFNILNIHHAFQWLNSVNHNSIH